MYLCFKLTDSMAFADECCYSRVTQPKKTRTHPRTLEIYSLLYFLLFLTIRSVVGFKCLGNLSGIAKARCGFGSSGLASEEESHCAQRLMIGLIFDACYRFIINGSYAKQNPLTFDWRVQPKGGKQLTVAVLGGVVLRHGDAVKDGVTQLARCVEEISHRCGGEIGINALPRAGG